MSTDRWLTAIVIVSVVSALAGGVAGSGKHATLRGVLMGFLLGPLGVLATLGIDGRRQCPRCDGRLDGHGRVCQHCRVALVWVESQDSFKKIPKLADAASPSAPPPAPPRESGLRPDIATAFDERAADYLK
jgi:hypothetical protein